MNILIGLALSLVVVLSPRAFAKENPLSQVAKNLAIAKDVNDFIHKTVSLKIIQTQMKEYAKFNKINQLPKGTFENNTLTLIAPEAKMTVEIADGTKGEFAINGKSFVFLRGDSFSTIIEKLEKLTATKTSFLQNLFLPEANAMNPVLVGFLFVIGAAVTIGVDDLMNTTCDELANDYRKIVKEASKGLVYVSKVSSCDIDNTGSRTSKVEIFEQPEKDNSTVKITIPSLISDDLLQNSIEQELLDGRKVKYSFTRNNSDSSIRLSGVTENGVSITDPGKFKIYQQKFDSYIQVTLPLMSGTLLKCGNKTPKDKDCDLVTFNEELKNPGSSQRKVKPGRSDLAH